MLSGHDLNLEYYTLICLYSLDICFKLFKSRSRHPLKPQLIINYMYLSKRYKGKLKQHPTKGLLVIDLLIDHIESPIL